MKEVKKSPAKKAAPKAPAAKKAVAKVAPKAAAVAKPAAQKKSALTPEQRYKMIEETAYFVAERHGFNGDSAYFWSLAEAEVDSRLK
jgi:hypothetical protein